MNFITAHLICLTLCISDIILAKQLPSYINACHRNDKNISQCWENVIRSIRPILAEKGMPEFSVPPLEPLRIDEIKLDQPSTASVSFKAVLKNLKFDGPGNFTVSDSYVNLDTLKFRTVLRFPRWTMEGEYTAKGKVLLFEFDSDGKVHGDFGDIVANGTWQLGIFEKKGKKHLSIDEQSIDVGVEKMFIQLDDLFKGNKELTANVNDAINTNIDLLYNDFKPILSTTIETVFKSYASRLYNAVPFDQLYP